MPIIGNNEKIDSSGINEIIYNDLLDVDPGTLSLINTLQVQDLEVQNGQDEATLILVNKLEKERELEQRNYDLEKEKEAAKAVEKTKDNFPDLEKPKKSSQQQLKNGCEYQGKIVDTVSESSEAHKMYLVQKAQSYKKELESILNSSKNTVAPGREYCENCDPRFKVLSSPEKTRNNLLLQKQIRYKEGHVVFT